MNTMKQQHAIYFTIVAIILICCTGCVNRYAKIITPEGHQLLIKVPSLGSKSKIKSMTLSVDGVQIKLEGYESDQVQAFNAGVQAARSLLSAAKP